MTKPKKYGSPRYTGHSPCMRVKNRIEDKHGPLKNDGTMWNPSELDNLLDLFLKGQDGEEINMGFKSIAIFLNRSVESVKTCIRKLVCADYSKTGKIIANYQPLNRIDRAGIPLTRRDRYIVKLLVDHVGGREKVGEDDIFRLSRVLGKPYGEVIEVLGPKRTGFGLLR